MKKILFYTLFLSALLFASCNDWLDVKPKAEVDVNEMFNKEKGFKDALTACYIKLNAVDLYGRRLTMTDIEYLAQHWNMGANHLDVKSVEKLKNFEYTTDYAREMLSAVYGGLYNVITQANILLENLADRGDVIRNEEMRALIEAEALAIRAFCHMDILRLFGQMPQGGTRSVQLPYAKTVGIAAVPYYSFEAFKDLILDDIEAAEELLSEHDPVLDYSFIALDRFTDVTYNVELEDSFLGYRRFRFNYYALQAMRARLYLYLGGDYKDEAYLAAKSVIDAKDADGSKKLALAGVADFTTRNYALPSECILALSNFEMTKNIENLFDPEEGIYINLLDLQNDVFAGQLMSVNNRAINVWNTAMADNWGMIKPVIRKYDQPGTNEYTNSNMLATQKQVIPLIRLSEMYLIAMETAGSLAEANALYVEYMRARNVVVSSLTEAELRAELLREYRREFFAEGQMFYTYKRLGVENMLWKNDRTVGEADYIAPLPTSEVNANR